MRLEFLGSVRQISKLLSAKAEPNSRSASESGFDTELNKTVTQDSELTTKSTPSIQPNQLPKDDIMARFKFDNYQQRSPEIDIPKPIITESEAVKNSTNSVKSPSLVEARKINPYADLNYGERVDAVRKLVSKYGGESGVDPLLAMSVAGAESSFNPSAVSSDGFYSKGLFQLLDSTGKELHQQSGVEEAYDPFSPNQNTKLGVQYLRKLHDIFSRGGELAADLPVTKAANSTSLEKLAVAAFNAGEGRVASAQSRAKAAGKDPSLYDEIAPYLPKTTQEYVSRVMKFRNEFEGLAFGKIEEDLKGKNELARRLQEVSKGSVKG